MRGVEARIHDGRRSVLTGGSIARRSGGVDVRLQANQRSGVVRLRLHDGRTSWPSDNAQRSTLDSRRHAFASWSVWLALFVVTVNSAWAIYHYQFENMPLPLGAEHVGKRGFSEIEAMKHVEALTGFGMHPVGSDELDRVFEYVSGVTEEIKKTTHLEVDVQVDLFHSESGVNTLVSGLFVGKTLAYSDLNHVVLRILPKHDPKAEENAVLISSHNETVFTTYLIYVVSDEFQEAGDCSSCVAVMLELARGVSHWAHGFKNAVIFLFNRGGSKWRP